jgi:hypothetical protein
MKCKLSTSLQFKNPLKKESNIQRLFRRLHKYTPSHESKQLFPVDAAFCDYTSCKRKTTIYRCIFSALGILFLMLAVLLLSSNIYIGFPFGPMPTAKHAVAFICTLLALPAFYLAVILNPFDELFKNLQRQSLRRLVAYWHLSGLAIEKHTTNTEHERLCELLRRKARRDAEDNIRRLMKNTRRKQEQLMQLEMTKKTREKKYIDLLHHLEQEVDNTLKLFKQNIDTFLQQLIASSIYKQTLIEDMP